MTELDALWPVLAPAVFLAAQTARGGQDLRPLLFGTHASDDEGLRSLLALTQSLRTFGGAYRNATILVYSPPALLGSAPRLAESLRELAVEFRTSKAPEDAAWFFFADKVFAAAEAEEAAAGKAARLAWIGEDTVFLQEPIDFVLPAAKMLGYRPVMHRNIGCRWSEPLDMFWRQAYAVMAVREETLFPMRTVADDEEIQPYFNAGCLIVRPECGTLRRWVENFRRLYRDKSLAEMCAKDRKKRIFLHQLALTGAVLNHLPREALLELPDRINYPLFFDRVFGARRTFDDINGVVTLRHESYFRDPAPDWAARLNGPADRIAWIREHLAGR